MNQVSELLAALGPDADAIAVFLSHHGFQGARGAGEDCPLASYLRAQGIREPAIDLSTVSYLVGERLVEEELPPAAENFVHMFDDGAYPELLIDRS